MKLEDASLLREEQEERAKSMKSHRRHVCGIIIILIVVMAGSFAFVEIVFGTGWFDKANKHLEPQMRVPNLQRHLTAFSQIATANGGSRTAQTGYNASLSYVVNTLNSSDISHFFNIQIQNLSLTQTSIMNESFAIVSPSLHNFSLSYEYRFWYGSPPANLTSASVSKVQNYGCNAADFQGFPANTVALIYRGNCTFQEKANNSMAAGASAIIFTIVEYADECVDAPIYSRVTSNIPVLAVRSEVGAMLLLNPNTLIDLTYLRTQSNIGTANVIATTKSGNSSHVIVVGSHLDSVAAGPGLNDNGSGSSLNLELAVQMAKLGMKIKNQVKFVWFAGEELGLIGSTYYVNSLNASQLSEIALNLNFDMVASPNYFVGVYDGASAEDVTIRNASANLQTLFEEAFESNKILWAPTEFDGRSDYGPFIEQGIPAAGLFTGAEQIKYLDELEAWGGLAGAAFDPCYHQFCDTTTNIDYTVFIWNARAAAKTLETLAMHSDLRGWLNSTIAPPTPPINITMTMPLPEALQQLNTINWLYT